MYVLFTIRATLITVTISGHAALSASTFQNNVGAQITCGDNQILLVWTTKFSENESGKGMYFDGLIHEFSLKILTSQNCFLKTNLGLHWKNTTSLGHEVTPNPQRRAVRGLLTVSSHPRTCVHWDEWHAPPLYDDRKLVVKISLFADFWFLRAIGPICRMEKKRKRL